MTPMVEFIIMIEGTDKEKLVQFIICGHCIGLACSYCPAAEGGRIFGHGHCTFTKGIKYDKNFNRYNKEFVSRVIDIFIELYSESELMEVLL